MRSQWLFVVCVELLQFLGCGLGKLHSMLVSWSGLIRCFDPRRLWRVHLEVPMWSCCVRCVLVCGCGCSVEVASWIGRC